MTNSDALLQCFRAQKAAFQKARYPEYPARLEHLTRLKNMIRADQQALTEAIAQDFLHRSSHETAILEVFPSLQAISHAQRHLKRWMKPKRRPVAFWYWPARAMVIPQPLGVVGIIVPWNYPVYLAIGPLVDALAAGNRVMIKVSEATPHTGTLLERLFSQTFAADHVTVVTGDAQTGAVFSALPFDHLLFTGSTSVGKKVMQAASQHLTPVTLELGGKSPAVIGPDYPIARAAEKIAFGKWVNAGQTCIAPDYVFVPEASIEPFVEALKESVQRYYSKGVLKNPDYSCIINEPHFNRLQALLFEATVKGARAIPLVEEKNDLAARKLMPHVILQATDTMQIMQEEIFGPLLPVLSYRTLEEVIAFINARAHPLALYYFGYNKRDIEKILKETLAGGVTVNGTILHIAQEELPFGGVGASGMGHYHGEAGFNTFSKQKGVLTVGRWNALPLFYPPFTRTTEWILKWMLRLS